MEITNVVQWATDTPGRFWVCANISVCNAAEVVSCLNVVIGGFKGTNIAYKKLPERNWVKELLYHRTNDIR